MTDVIEQQDSVVAFFPRPPRTEKEYPVVDLETPFGYVRLIVLGKREATLKNLNNDFITINRVRYTFDARFVHGDFYGHNPTRADMWRRDSGHGLHLTKSGSYVKSYTDAAFKTFEERITPLIVSYLTQNPNLGTEAEKVALNNKIFNIKRDIEGLIDRVDFLTEEISDLEKLERSL